MGKRGRERLREGAKKRKRETECAREQRQSEREKD